MRAVLIISLLSLNMLSFSQSISDFTVNHNEIRFKINNQIRKVVFYFPNIVRVSTTKDGCLFNDTSLAVNFRPEMFDLKLDEKPTNYTISTEKLSLQIGKTTGEITFLSTSGKVYLSEKKNLVSQLIDTLIYGKKYFHIKQSFQISKDEGLFGLGQFQNGIMNYRNHDLLLVQANKIAIVPFLVSTNNYGLLWDNYSHSTFHDGNDGMYFTSSVADQIDYYFICSSNIDGVISGYRTLTGKAPLFSKKAYGFWQSKERYTSFDELNDVVDKYRANHIPIDNIIQDWRYWGDGKFWSSMNFEPEFYSNPKENIQKLHDKNVDLMVSIWPSLGVESDIYKEMLKGGFLFKQKHWCGGQVYDAYNPKARKIYWNYIKEGLAKNGVDGYWMDGTEPEYGSTDDQEITEKEILKAETCALGPIAKYLNPYALATSEGVYLGHREFTNDKRVFILTRSSWAGQQRNATVTWSGDVSANWENLKIQICAGINFCMSGVPYWTHDIGAFFPSGRGGIYSKGIDDPSYQELYVRWFQFGAFTPIFRSHGTGTPREVWQFKDRNPELYNALLKTLNIRYKLIPYIYSNAWQVTSNDYTIMRGLAMDFSEDKATYNINDQYMFGSSLLIKPITRNMYYDLPSIPKKIETKNLQTLDGKPGLNACYFKDIELSQKVHESENSEVNFNWAGGGLPSGVPAENFSVRWEGYIVPSGESGLYKIAFTADDGVRLWIDSTLVINEWNEQSAATYMHEMNMETGKKYHITIEYYQGSGDSFASLGWKTPSEIEVSEKKDMTEKVYLPKNNCWFDFWTNKYYVGGKYISDIYPIDKFPIFVKAGSIIPLGPEQEYIGQHSEDTIYLNVYTGRDASFTLYEDEGNSYNYEKGKFNTIDFHWSDKDGFLDIVQSKRGLSKPVKKIFIISTFRYDSKNGKTIETKHESEFNGEKIRLQLKLNKS